MDSAQNAERIYTRSITNSEQKGIGKYDRIHSLSENNILDEEDFIALFTNIDLEKITNEISKSSYTINNLLRNIDSQKRPILLSALMICLYNKNADFSNNCLNWQIQTIVQNISNTVRSTLENEGLDANKIAVLINELSFINTDNDINTSDILRSIIRELKDKVIPLFDTQTAYDIIGKFYEEFLRYAGIANVKKGIVLTPHHVTQLFTELIELNTEDVIFDPACGTGAFLIAGMNALVSLLEQSQYPNRKEKIRRIKTQQLIGIEKSTSMFTLAISNMLFRGDGKSSIYNEDFFSISKKTKELLQKTRPTIGFVNPPYGGKDNEKNPTKKEIQFLIELLELCTKYVVIIAPLSTYFKDADLRAQILAKHTLLYVINMPNDLFLPNAMSHTAIAVFRSHVPHNKENNVIFYDLQDDGLVLSKNKGRTDPLNKWNAIKKDTLKKIKNPLEYADELRLVSKAINTSDEWIIQAHSKTDYSSLCEEDFLITIRKYSIFKIKKELDLFNTKFDEIKLFEILLKRLTTESLIDERIALNLGAWREFKISDLFHVRGSRKSYTKLQVEQGNYSYITTSNRNNGYSGTSNVYTEEGNVISFDSATEGICFYQEDNFVGSDHVDLLIPKNFTMNKYSGLFIISILNKDVFRYSFGRKRSQARMKMGSLYLPARQEKPDWECMEAYIQSLPYSSNI